MANYTYDPAPLAAGGEKVVHRGQCVETGATVAVKFLRRPYTPQDVQRMAAEVERARRGKGTGIAEIVDWNMEWDPPFLIEEFFPEGSLAQRMRRVFDAGNVFTLPWSIGWARQILRQLGGLHARNIVHRDVKPANIMVRGDLLVLGDMGIGRTLARPTMLQTRAFVGTPGYAAPEQELQRRVDHRADIYAVGVIFHEMLTGTPGSYGRISYRARADVAHVMRSMLAFDPNARPSSCDAASTLLARLRVIGQARKP